MGASYDMILGQTENLTMPQFTATIEFYDIANSTDNAKDSLAAYFKRCPNYRIKSIVKTSITHEEAIKLIAAKMEDYKNYSDVSLTATYDDIQYILEKVI